jgi:hypothetical protein
MKRKIEEIEIWKQMLTDQEKAEMVKMNHFISQNHGRVPVKITIEFEHRRFSDNKGFATINIPLSKGHVVMPQIHESIKNTIEQLLF